MLYLSYIIIITIIIIIIIVIISWSQLNARMPPG